MRRQGSGFATLAGIWKTASGRRTGGTVAKEPEIWNGPHQGQPVGELPAFDGGIVLVWSYGPADILSAMIRAVGPIPEPPALLVNGQFMVVRQFDASKPLSDAGPPQVVYDPSQDEANKAIAAMYAAEVEAWNKRAELIYQAGLALFAKATTQGA